MTVDRRARAARGQTHPVDDFLYTYYSYKPAILRRWHPGAGVRLLNAAQSPRAHWRGYLSAGDDLVVDAASFARERPILVRAIAGVLKATALKTPAFGCFGLHEWAMLYKNGEVRHDAPLRLGASGTDAVVESHELRCTHFDAFRFFTLDAVPRNASELSADARVENEQPGCLHSNMDLYKWAVKLGPLVPGRLLLETFDLARSIREIDMRASPYDLSDWGYEPITIETTAGKTEYGRMQRAFEARAAPIRNQLLRIANNALAA
nr:3-methyladenine DNA glycosylase [Microbacterium halimionae]